MELKINSFFLVGRNSLSTSREWVIKIEILNSGIYHWTMFRAYDFTLII